MLYYLFEILENQFNLPGASLFSYLSFRAAITIIMSLMISIVFGKKIINYLKKKQIGENVRELGLEGEDNKKAHKMALPSVSLDEKEFHVYQYP